MTLESDRPFAWLVDLVERETGASLSLLQLGRLEQQARALRGPLGWAPWLARLAGAGGEGERRRLAEAVTVHTTSLWRDEGQLEALRHAVLEPLAVTGRPVHLWSAGCSTGEEVATLLVLLAQVGAAPGSTVLGTDLSEPVLARARSLSFEGHAVEALPPQARCWFDVQGNRSVLSPALAARARFARHNLLEGALPTAPGGAPFDVVVCRNVLIYLGPEATESVLAGLASRLAPGGTLVLSAVEPILDPRADLEPFRAGASFFYRPRTALPQRPSPPRPAPPARLESPPAAPAPAAPDDALADGLALFEHVLDWSGVGRSAADVETGLRRALYLAPSLAAARYVLALHLGQHGDFPAARAELRRALSSLESGTAQGVAFFLNDERLAGACRLALERFERRGASRE